MMAPEPGEVLDGSARLGPRLRYEEHAPPDDLADLVEGIGQVWVPAGAPRRTWRLVADLRSRLWLPLSPGGRGRFAEGGDRPRDAVTPEPGTYLSIRFAPWARAFAASLAGGMPAESHAEARVDPLGTTHAWLRRSLPRDRPDRRAMVCWRAIMADPTVPGATLAGRARIAERSLRRVLQRTSGSSLRTAREIERFLRLLRLLRLDLQESWPRAALAAGYCDQSHMNRAFLRFAGMSPYRFFGRGHHHFNDVFASRAIDADAPRTLAARGAPWLRTARPEIPPGRDRRFARATRRGARRSASSGLDERSRS